MSIVAIQGGATGTGTVTVVAPSTSTNRTLTLPDQTGTVLTNSAEVLNIGSGQVYKDAAGKVGIGTTSPVAKLAVVGGTSNASSLATAYSLAAFNITPKSSSGYSLQFGSGPADLPYIQMSAGGAASGDMTIQPYGGNLLVNQTSQTGAEKVGISFDRTGSWGLAIKNTSSTAPNNATYVQFYYASTNTGGINSTGTTTSYATTSDYRLKEAIAPMTGALAKVVALKPVTYKWKSTGESDEGFIAHELQEVCPSAVTGEKDAMDAEGNPQYQGIDTSFLVATLTAAIQELKALVDTQAARITALEAA